ncbi:MAG: VWA domain-containing protein, partial [Methanosarcinales archaeon]
MDFSNPKMLILLFLLPFIYFLSKNSLADLSPQRKKIALILRIIIILLVIFALAGFQAVKQKQDLSVFFLLDVSDSMKVGTKYEYGLSYIKEAISSKGKEDLAGMIVFGSKAYIEMPPTHNKDWNNLSIASFPSTKYTDISSAIKLAIAAFPDTAEKRIVIVSDGNENLGDAVKAAVLAKASEIQIYTVPLSSRKVEDVLLEKIVIPDNVKIGETFKVKIIANSLKYTKTKLKLFRDGIFIGEKEVYLTKGKNVFAYPQKIEATGFHIYEAILDAQDTIAENNRVIGYTVVKGKSKVLYIEGSEERGKYLKNAITSEGIDFVVKNSYAFPTSLAELLNYDALILSDVSALNLSEYQMLAVQRYVSDFGGGLIMIGGENSFGAGGYLKTPIEEALPVSMDLRKRKEFPSVAIGLVIDKSGSMGEKKFGIQKIDLAKEAALEVVELLTEKDKILVVAFDSASKVVVPMQGISEEKKEDIIESIASIKSGGGTDIYPALKDAIELIKTTDAKLKHIILLSDGRTQPADFYGLVKDASNNKITVSAIAIGEDADIPLMRDIAKIGNGRFYYTEDPRTIPRIFTKEALLASKSLIVEEAFFPKVVEDHQMV